jgi:hypothetical protein
MTNRMLSILALGSALCAAQSAMADTIRLGGWWSNNGGGSANISYTGVNLDGQSVSGLHQEGRAGGIATTNLSSGGSSFQSWSVDLFHEFSFPVASADTKVPGGAPGSLISAAKADDLGLLYTARHELIDGRGSSKVNTSAFQLAVWEIVYTSGSNYDLASGAFRASGTGAAQAAVWLSQLHDISASQYGVSIWQVQRDGEHGERRPQDVAVFAPLTMPADTTPAAVPLSGIPAMLAGGLGLLGFAARRRQAGRTD